jgi:hypothetical protein
VTCTAAYVSGPALLTAGQTTRLSLDCDVHNPLSVPLDYTSTVLLDTGPGITVTSLAPDVGQAVVRGNQIQWGGFQLAAGESAGIVVTADLTPASVLVGRPAVVVATSTTTARAATGGFVNVTGQQLTTAQVAGLQGGGFVTAVPAGVTRVVPTPVVPGAAPARPGGPAAAAPGAISPAPGAVAGAVAAPPATTAPRVGTGTSGEPRARNALIALLLGGLLAAVPVARAVRRRRA